MTVTPYFEDDRITLYCGDFRTILPQITDRHSLDLAVVDPPYGETQLPWDRWPGGWPAAVPTRSMWCCGSMRMFLTRRDEFAGWKLSQDVVWEKQQGSGFATDRLCRVHEHALHWYRGAWNSIHHDTPRVVSERPDRGRVRKLRDDRAAHLGAIKKQDYVDDGFRLLRSVIRVPNPHGKAINETEKPVGLLQYLIGYGCPPGGTVLDIMAGSCSTLVAARNLGLRSVGIELREEQCAKAVEHRLSHAALPFEYPRPAVATGGPATSLFDDPGTEFE